MKNVFKKAYVIAYFDSTGCVDFFHGFNMDGVPMWGCYSESLRVSPITAWMYLQRLHPHSGSIQVLSFKEALDAIFNQPFYLENPEYLDDVEYVDDPDYIAELSASEVCENGE